MDQVKFVEDSQWNIWMDTVRLNRPYPFKFLKGCLPQILRGLFLNTLFHFKVQFYKICELKWGREVQEFILQS